LRLLIDELSDVDVHTVALPSSGEDPETLGDMYADADVIAAAATAIDGPLVVVACAYAGIPATQALGRVSNVERIVYLSGFQLDEGESVYSLRDGEPPSWAKIHRREGIGDYLEPLDPVSLFYGDVDPAIARNAVAQLGYWSYAAGSQQLTAAAWKSISSTYIVCEADKAIPPSWQKQFALRANRVRRLASSHSPFLSQPAQLAALLREELASAHQCAKWRAPVR
jgi:pimeloyl-ACP methyl ester carboxylesterase